MDSIHNNYNSYIIKKNMLLWANQNQHKSIDEMHILLGCWSRAKRSDVDMLSKSVTRSRAQVDSIIYYYGMRWCWT